MNKHEDIFLSTIQDIGLKDYLFSQKFIFKVIFKVLGRGRSNTCVEEQKKQLLLEKYYNITDF